MAEIVNLRMARKARDRAKAEQQAAENRVRFGRTKMAKQKERADKERAARDLEGAKRDESDGGAT